MAAAALALDLGTTTLTGRLLGDSGTILAEARLANPQSVYGADVIRRLEAALGGAGAALQSLLCAGIAQLVADLCQSAQLPLAAIDRAALAANPAIVTLLCGDDPARILFPPHRLRRPHSRIIQLPDAGLDNLPVTIFPAVSGFAGGDLVAFLYGECERRGGGNRLRDFPALLIDIGTNAELVAGVPGDWHATSVAAGPAFEGGEIRCGMVAAPGAIVDAEVRDDRLQLVTVEDRPPLGLAGSGLFAVVALARQHGLIDASGRILSAGEVASPLSRYLAAGEEGHEIVLYRDAQRRIFVSQSDVRAFQLGKGAVRAGVDILLARARLSVDAVRATVMTGSFGLSLPPERLKNVAILPDDMVKNTVCRPAGALAGVSRFLAEKQTPDALDRFCRTIAPCPLSGSAAFEAAFLRSLDFAEE